MKTSDRKTKRCYKCGKLKLARFFDRSSCSSDGLYTYCKICKREYASKWWSDHPNSYVKKKKRNGDWIKEVKRIPIRVFNRARQSAEKRGMPFNLTVKWVENKIKEGCAITRQPFDLSTTAHRPFSPSIDRKDSSRGYTIANCHIVYLIYNYAKNEFSHKDVLKLARMLV